MVRRVTPSQLQSMVRQAAQNQQHAIDRYNRAARQYNAEVRRGQNNLKRAVDNYNREVRAHNSRVLSNRHRLHAALARLAGTNVLRSSTTYYRSVTTLHRSYEDVEAQAPGTWLEGREDILDLAQQEASRSVAVAEAANTPGDATVAEQLMDAEMDAMLSTFSPDLTSRWRGALFAVNPRNPDAARHFSTSAREILSAIIELEAPDKEVMAADRTCAVGPDGRPTRRARLTFCLTRSGRASESLTAFADADIDNVLELFRVFNDGTHGSAGVYDLGHLALIRERVEGAVRFMHSILR